MQISGRAHERLSKSAILLVTGISVALASPVRAGQSPGQPAADECRTLLSIDVFNQAIARCEEAVRLDPKLPDPYLMLGTAYDRLWQQETRAGAAPNAERVREHRRKAAENYQKFLGMTPGDTEARLGARAPALGGLLALYVMSSTEKSTTENDPADALPAAPATAMPTRMIPASCFTAPSIHVIEARAEIREPVPRRQRKRLLN